MGKQFISVNKHKLILLERLYSENWMIYDEHYSTYTLYKSTIDYQQIINELEDKIKNLEQQITTNQKSHQISVHDT